MPWSAEAELMDLALLTCGAVGVERNADAEGYEEEAEAVRN